MSRPSLKFSRVPYFFHLKRAIVCPYQHVNVNLYIFYNISEYCVLGTFLILFISLFGNVSHTGMKFYLVLLVLCYLNFIISMGNQRFPDILVIIDPQLMLPNDKFSWHCRLAIYGVLCGLYDVSVVCLLYGLINLPYSVCLVASLQNYRSIYFAGDVVPDDQMMMNQYLCIF